MLQYTLNGRINSYLLYDFDFSLLLLYNDGDGTSEKGVEGWKLPRVLPYVLVFRLSVHIKMLITSPVMDHLVNIFR